MAEKNDFRIRVVNILKKLKLETGKKPDELRLSIKNEDETEIIAYMIPISENIGKEEKYVELLAEWRERNWQAYPTVFKVTKEGTKKWIQDQLIDREDRILFMIVTLDNQPIGHMGLSNFDFDKREAEIDNVVRGVNNVLPGVMTLALKTLINWSFTELGLNRLFLRVFLENERAIKLYERCGFKGVKKIPLHKTIDGNTIKFEEIPDGQNLSVDRIFYLMELTNKKHLTGGIGIMDKMILTAGPSITQKEINYVLDAVKNGWNENWDNYLKRFEKSFAEFIGVKYALATSSCTGAMHLALLSLGINEGDELIVPDLAWVATAAVVKYLRAEPVLVDVMEDTWCLDPQAVRRAITPKTKAIMPVHLYGHPCEMDEIMKIASEYNLYVIEDAAQSIGSLYKGKRPGSIGHIGCFSFQGAKIMVTGEGGMLVTDNVDFYEKAKFYNNHARDPRGSFWIFDIGYKYKMSNIQAALGLAQLERIEELVEKKRLIYKWYKERLGNVNGLKLNVEKPNVKNNYWMTSIVLDKDFGINRDDLMKTLKEKCRVDTRAFFYPISKFKPYSKRTENKVSEYLALNGINLPSGHNLTESDIDRVTNGIKEILKV